MAEYTLLEIQEIEDILLVHELPTDTLINGTPEQRASLRSLLETDIAISSLNYSRCVVNNSG